MYINDDLLGVIEGDIYSPANGPLMIKLIDFWCRKRMINPLEQYTFRGFINRCSQDFADIADDTPAIVYIREPKPVEGCWQVDVLGRISRTYLN